MYQKFDLNCYGNIGLPRMIDGTCQIVTIYIS